jgi:hypothetical protein
MLIVLTTLSYSLFSQETEKPRKISISPTAYYVSTTFLNGDYNGTSYESLSSNSTGEYTFDINIPIAKKLEIKTGLGFNQRFGEAYISNIENVRVNESFVRIPLLLTYILPINNSKVYLSLGPNADILASQKFYFKDNSLKPNDFDDSYGFGSYIKIGLIIRTGFRFTICDKLYFDCGLIANTDYKSLFINPNNNPSYDYGAYGLYISLGMY